MTELTADELRFSGAATTVDIEKLKRLAEAVRDASYEDHSEELRGFCFTLLTEIFFPSSNALRRQRQK